MIKRQIANALFFITLMPVGLGCAKQNYSPIETEAHQKYQRGDFEGALETLEKEPFRKQDRLLYLLDKGTFLHAAGRYEESNTVFEKAYHLAEYLESKSAGEEIAAALTNETLLPYSGEIYERLLIQVFQLLNYALLGKTDEALVEVRQYHNDLHRFFGSKVPKDYEDAFALELASILWEMKRQGDDARIDHQKALKANPTAKEIGEEGNVILIVESGLAPVLEGEKTWVADVLIELPKIKERESRADVVEIDVDKKKRVIKTIPLNNITTMVRANLDHKLEIAKDHKFFKTALKQWGEAKILYSKSPGLAQKIFMAAAISIVANSLEAADLRIWSTLPNTFLLARFSLPTGEHTLKIRGAGKTIRKKIKVENKPLFLAIRLF